jgi:glycosyltransferase involved in cell wall biosynthesis
MKFSIISVGRNNEKWLKQHIDSVKSQTFTDYEHIIIDDASNDKSIEVIQDNCDKQKTKVFVRKERAYSARNHILGMKQAKGDIIILLDGDDWFYSDNVLNYINDVYEKENCLATYGSWVHKNDLSKKNYTKHPTHVATDVRNIKCWYFSHLRTFKRELLSAVNGMDIFDEYGDVVNYAPDVVLLTGIYEYALKFGKVIYVEEPLVVYNSNTGFNEGHLYCFEQTKAAKAVQNSPYSILNLL